MILTKMKYSGLAKKEREDIFSLFLNREKLKFNEIEKLLNIRSNMLSYHLSTMRKEKILEKSGEYYLLTKSAEKYIPLFSHIKGEQLSPLPIILIATMHKNNILLIKRTKRPYKNYWSMIGGKILFEESFVDASKRKVKAITSLDCDFISMNGVLHERVLNDDLIKQSFILFFTKVNAKSPAFKRTDAGELKWFSINKLPRSKIIPSDLWLIENRLNKRMDVKSAFMPEMENRLKGLSFVK